MPLYVPREQNVIQKILKDHFSDFEKQYNEHYAKQYDKYRIIRIKEAVEKFLECGDYTKGVARIKCTNRDCTYEYFRPFVASLKGTRKSWYLCPSCNQKRLQLFAEHLSENVLFLCISFDSCSSFSAISSGNLTNIDFPIVYSFVI